MLAMVVELMSDVLEIEVQADQNFAELGNSVDAIELCARLNERLGVQVPIELLWEVPDVAAFADRIEALAAARF